MEEEANAASAAVFDRAAALRRAGDDPEFLRELIEIFLEDVALRLEHLHAGLRNASAPEVRAAAHSLKGSASAIGGDCLANAAAELEHRARAGDLSDADALVAALEKQIELLRAALEGYTSSSGGGA